jgi:mRNA interferase RelE/StbE
VPSYRIEFAPRAEREFRKLTHDLQERLGKTIDKLGSNPLPSGVRKLSGEKDLFRVRVGDYRIIYQIRAAQLIILVVRLGHRKDIY